MDFNNGGIPISGYFMISLKINEDLTKMDEQFRNPPQTSEAKTPTKLPPEPARTISSAACWTLALSPSELARAPRLGGHFATCLRSTAHVIKN